MRRTVLIPLIVACALFMENMDSTVIATSLPAIAADVGESPLALKLALTSYLVSLAVFIPISGWVADRYGSRSVFAAAIVVFMCASVMCAFAHSLVQFVAFRFVQGLGGAMMVPVGRLVLMRAVPKNEYVAALSYLTIPALLGPVIGPALGGAITLYLHWRWIFLINVPISIVGIVLVLRHIPNVREAEIPRFDVVGFVLSGAGLSILMLGLSALGGHLMNQSAAMLCVTIGAGTLALYTWWARRIPHPVINLALFRLPTFWNGVAIGNLFRIGAGATPFLMPLLLQIGFGLDPLASGLLTCVTSMGAMFMKTVSVRILRHWGFRTVLVVNGALAALSIAACGLFTAATPHAIIATVLLVGGLLRSLQFSALNAIAFADIEPGDMSQAASVSSMLQRLAQSLGIAFGAYVLQLSSEWHGRASITAADFTVAFFAVGFVALLSVPIHRRLAPYAGAAVSGHAA
jgi:EmrB/QacA subfamily drug resistance transporter